MYVIARGKQRQNIFGDNSDREKLLNPLIDGEVL